MPAIITNEMRIRTADVFAESIKNIPTYIYIGGLEPWPNETLPPDVKDSSKQKIDQLKDIVAMKRVKHSDVISVIPRRDWRHGDVYDEYSDNYNLIDEKNPDTDTFFKFYVITSEFNVYKCISNKNRSPSTVMPSGQTNQIFQTPDGYMWKYMYTVRSSDAFKFMTPTWIPCYTLYASDGTTQWNIQQTAVNGTIDKITVTNAGAHYSQSNPPSVRIQGDGTGANAVCVIDKSGSLLDIIVTDHGKNYTHASVSIIDVNGNGVGANAEAIISPVGGHGHDARKELGATYCMVRVRLEGNEDNTFPTDIKYRKAGIISNPLGNTTGMVVVVNDTSLFRVGETLRGISSSAKGIIRSIESTRGYLYVQMQFGEFIVDEQVQSQQYNTISVDDVILNVHLPMTTSVAPVSEYKMFSGDLLYFSNREKVSRDKNQTEEVMFIISF